MTNKLIKKIALTIFSASMISVVSASAEPFISTEKGCDVANYEFQAAIIAANKENRFLNVKFDKRISSGLNNKVCFANLIYDVSSESEARELHAKVQDYIGKSTDYTILKEPRITKIK